MWVVNGQIEGPLIEANQGESSFRVARRSLHSSVAEPGSLSRDFTGDTINVHVKNNLMNGTAIHWHVSTTARLSFLPFVADSPSLPQGIAQNGTVWADGPNGATQCPIPSGQTFTYRFTFDREDQYGSYCEFSRPRSSAAHSPKLTFARFSSSGWQ